jgi:hypothetical protein
VWCGWVEHFLLIRWLSPVFFGGFGTLLGPEETLGPPLWWLGLFFLVRSWAWFPNASLVLGAVVLGVALTWSGCGCGGFLVSGCGCVLSVA